jgi:chromosome segregation ATPase
MPDQVPKPPRHHLLIAGTGRAGTSFLVRWFAASGLRTHLATHDTPEWDEDANAGLEDLGAAINWEGAPYVLKSPWFVEVIDEVLANPHVVLDGVIIPVRCLTEAAASRVVHERQAAYRATPWLTGFGHSFEQWGTTPGGVVYSLDPVDQARLLAVSFHRLVQRLVKADIPVVLLDFPRLALDADYLFRKLRRFVPATMAQAVAAHAGITDPEKVRIGRELAALQQACAPETGRQVHDLLDAVALRREVRHLLDQLAEAARAATAQRKETAALRSALDMRAVDLVGLASAPEVRDATAPEVYDAAESEAGDAAASKAGAAAASVAGDPDHLASEAQVATLIATVEQRRAEAEHAATAQREAMPGMCRALEAQAVELAGLVAVVEARNADWQAAQAQIATLTAMSEERQADTDRSTAAHQAVISELRGAFDARASELTGLRATPEARDAMLAERDATLEARDATLVDRDAALAARDALVAERDAALTVRYGALAALNALVAERDAALVTRNADLERARTQIASLMAAAEQCRMDAERTAVEQQDVVAALRATLDVRAAALAGLTAALDARNAELKSVHAQIATLSSTAEQWRADSEHAAMEQQAAVTALRNALDARAVDLAGLATTLEARDADLEAARMQVASLATVAEQRRTDAERAAVEQQAVVAGLRDALGKQAAALAGAVAGVEALDAGLAAAQAQVASLIATAEQRQVDAGQAATEHQAEVSGLRDTLDARLAELDGLVGMLRAREADLSATQARIAALAAAAEQLRAEREATLASWTWKAGQPFRRAHRAGRAVITALGLGRPPAA